MFRKSLIAIALTVAASGSAYAQEQPTFEAWGHTFTRPGAQFALPDAPRAYDRLVTGSVYTNLGGRGDQNKRQVRRELDASAKGGNASHPNFLVPNYGGTSGGPNY